MTPLQNRYRSALHDLPEPDSWTDAKARAFARAVLTQLPPQLVDVYTVARATVIAARVCEIPHDLAPAAAAERIKQGLDRAAAHLERMRATFAADAESPPAVTPQTADRQSYARAWIDRIHRDGKEIYRVGDMTGAQLARVTRKDLKGVAA